MRDGGNQFRHTYFAQYHDCDTRQRLTVLAMMRYFEDIALLQSDSYDVGLAYYAKEEVAWLLHKWDIRIHRTPVFKDDVSPLTQPAAMRRFMANRRYEINNEAGEILVEADSQWVFVDLARRRPTRIREEIFSKYGLTDDVETLPTPPAPREPERTDILREFHIRKSDIDVNRHVNNIRYVDWALDALPEDIALQANMRRLLIHYKKEVHYGEHVSARTEMREEEGLVVGCHGIYVGEELRCLLESRWEI